MHGFACEFTYHRFRNSLEFQKKNTKNFLFFYNSHEAKIGVHGVTICNIFYALWIRNKLREEAGIYVAMRE